MSSALARRGGFEAAWKGGQTQIVGIMMDDAWDDVKHLQTIDNHSLQSYFSLQKPVLFQIPKAILNLPGLDCIVTPLHYASRHNVNLDSADADAVAVGDEAAGGHAGGDDGEGGHAGGDDADGGEWQNPGADVAERTWNRLPGYKENSKMDYSLRTPNFEIECYRMLWLLQNVRALPEVCAIAASIVCPGIDISRMPFPSFRALRDYMIKLDLLHMLCMREFYRPLDPRRRVARFLSPDSSPQGKGKGRHDYYCIVEESMRRPLPFMILPTSDPFGGFEWIRRSLPYQTIGRERGSVAVKLNRTVDSILLEVDKADFWGYRMEVKGSYMDQGSGERGIPKAPVGGKDEVDSVVEALRKGTLHLHEPEAQNVQFLPNSVDVSATLHIHGNALEAVLKRIAEWSDYDVKLRAFVKYCGDVSYKPLALETIFADAEAGERHFIHKLPGDVPSRKWEHMEDLHLHVIDAYPVFKKYYNEEKVGMKGTELAARLVACATCPFFGPFSELVYFICHVVGGETGWFESCYCHEVALRGIPGGMTRRRKLLELSGHQHCPWGRQAHGWNSTWAL